MAVLAASPGNPATPSPNGNARLSEPELLSLTKLAPVSQLAPDERLLGPGDPAASAYVVLHGRLAVMAHADGIASEFAAVGRGQPVLVPSGGNGIGFSLLAREPTSVLTVDGVLLARL